MVASLKTTVNYDKSTKAQFFAVLDCCDSAKGQTESPPPMLMGLDQTDRPAVPFILFVSAAFQLYFANKENRENGLDLSASTMKEMGAIQKYVEGETVAIPKSQYPSGNNSNMVLLL